MSGVSEEDLCGGYSNDGVPDSSVVGLVDGADPTATDFLCSQVEATSIQIQMDVTRETLKRRLMFRRTLPELVDQGIYPPLNVPPAFADRQRHLQRAQTGDRLRQKLKERPDRECLVQHHILEDTSRLVDRSLQDKQRLLKRHRLQSDLSGRLASRPGPLELVEKNILLTDHPQLKDGLIEGKIPFTKTTEVDDPVRRLLHPDVYHVENEDYGLGIGESSGSLDFSALVSTSDDSLPDSICLTPTDGAFDQALVTSSTASILSPPDTFSVLSPRIPMGGGGSPPLNIPPAPDITPLLQGSRKFQIVNHGFAPAPMFPFTGVQPVSTQSTVVDTPTLPLVSSDLTLSSDSTASVGVSSKRITKKPKNKNVTKSKVIKFHEYKGPSNRASAKSRPEPPRENMSSTAYHVLLEQQQLFLQFELQSQLDHKQQSLQSRQRADSGHTVTSTAVVTPAMAHVSSTASTDNSQPLSMAMSGVFSFKPSHMPVTSSVTKASLRLEEMKVTDLRAECKRLNLSSQGTKPQLIERLTPHIAKLGGQGGRESAMPSVRTSDSSLSGSSEVTSPVSASVDASLSNSQFGLLSSHNSVVPMTIDGAGTRPSSIVPMDVDHASSQTAGNFICGTPTAIILLQAAPQPQSLAKVPEVPGQLAGRDVATLKDQSRQQIMAMSQAPMTNFSSANVSSAQPLMFMAHPMLARGLQKAKPDNRRASLSAKPPAQPLQQPVHASQPNSGQISSDELVIYQQHEIASLKQSLQQYQQELIWTQQNARLRELQLNQSTVAQHVTTADGRKNGGVDHSLAPISTSNGINNQAMVRIATSQGDVLLPYKFNMNNNGTVASISGTMPSYKPLLRSATISGLPISSSLSSSTNSNAADSYLNSSLMSSSLTSPSLFLQQNQQQENTIEDVMELLMKQGELSNDGCFIPKDSCAAGTSNTASHLDNKPMFFLPEQSPGDGLKLQSELHSQPGADVFDSAGYTLDNDSFSSSIKFDPCSAMHAPGIEFSDIQKTSQETFAANGDTDPSEGLFALTNMEWSDLELDLMNVNMETGSFKDQSVGESTMGFVPSRLPDPSMFNDVGLDGHSLPLDINTEDWLDINNSSAPAFSFSSGPSSSTAQYNTNDEYLMMPRPTDTLDLFSIDDSELYMTPDLSTVMAFEKMLEAQTSKT